MLLVAGVGKWMDPSPTIAVLQSAGVSEGVAMMMCSVLPGLEVALGFSFLAGLTSEALYRIGIVLYSVFTLFLVALYFVPARPASGCNCFGSLLQAWTGGGIEFAIGRNCAALLGLAASMWLFKRELRGSPCNTEEVGECR